MGRRHHILKSAALVLFWTVTCRAERVLTWDDSVQIAKQKNPDLIAAERNWQASRSGYKESFNNILPRIALTDSFSRSTDDLPRANRWTARGTVSLDVFNMSSYAGISASRATQEAAAANFHTASSLVLLNLRRSFAALLYTQEQIRVSQTIYDIRKNNASLVSLRYDSGRESKGNKLRSQAELLQAQSEVTQSHRDQRAAQQEFRRQLGEENFEALIATGTLTTGQAAEETPLDSLTDQHPSVTESKADVASAKAALRDAKSAYWPNLTASYSRSVTGPDNFPDSEYNWTAGGVFSLPIFGDGLTSSYHSIAQARRRQQLSEENLRSTRYEVRSNLETSLSEFAASVDSVRVQRAFLVAARQRNREADIRYSNGLMSYEDWERIVTERVNFERSVVDAERAAVFAEAAWDNARGIGLGE